MKIVKSIALAILLSSLYVAGAFSTVSAQSGCWTTVDFEKDANSQSLAAGTVIDGQFAGWGLTVQVRNNNDQHPHAAVIFDSGNPSGGDTDLGTPNAAYGGPGEGADGGTNHKALGNLLIIAENDTDNDGDALLDQPDDEAGGGEMTFRFDRPVKVRNLTLVDIDKTENGALLFITMSDGTAEEVAITGLGDNSVLELPGEWADVQLLSITFPGSGAVAGFEFCGE